MPKNTMATDLDSLFPSLPDDARCWIHVTDAPLDDATEAAFLERLEAFLDTWTTHGRSVHGAATVVDHRFVVIAATVDDGAGVSGCGIDAAVHAMEDAATDLGVGWSPALHIIFRDADGTVQTLPRPAFRQRVQDGDVTHATPVFDPSLTRLGDVRDGTFEQRAGESWHARIFQIPEPA